jgi:hypothetical protein
MSCLGIHFSLSADEVQRLRQVEESERVDYVHGTIEEEYFESHRERLAQSDKAWDAMHRALADGQLTWDGGEYPLNHVILGGELLYTDSDFILVLKTPQQVRDVAEALSQITEDDFRRRYQAIDETSYDQPLSEEDFEYTWDNFLEVRLFWLKAAAEARYVLFTADQ